MSIKKKITVTIGIPAFNEEANIAYLLSNLLGQEQTGITLEKIIVISDGSTDMTVKYSKSIISDKIQILDRKIRMGASFTQNEITKMSNSDILVILDADVLPVNRNFLRNIIKPLILDKNIGIVGADTISANPKNFFEYIIATSHEFKKNIYIRINKGNNLYMCHGRARAFQKSIYKNIHWPADVPEDSYSYFFCLSRSKRFFYYPNAKVYFRSPNNISDHIKQSGRFTSGINKQVKYFGSKLIREQYRLPRLLVLTAIARSFIKNPGAISIYLLMTCWIRISSRKTDLSRSKWQMSLSTKKVK